jgi:hypothetical protein
MIEHLTVVVAVFVCHKMRSKNHNLRQSTLTGSYSSSKSLHVDLIVLNQQSQDMISHAVVVAVQLTRSKDPTSRTAIAPHWRS